MRSYQESVKLQKHSSIEPTLTFTTIDATPMNTDLIGVHE